MSEKKVEAAAVGTAHLGARPIPETQIYLASADYDTLLREYAVALARGAAAAAPGFWF